MRILDNKNVRLAIAGNIPVAAAPGLNIGSNLGLGWVSENKSGLYQEGLDPSGNSTFRPLCTLKRKHELADPP